MKIRIMIAGKPALDHARLGMEDYLQRLRRYGHVELVQVKAGDSSSVSAQLLDRSEGHYRIAMDERGQALTTRQWADTFTQLELRGDIKAVAFMIGASDGHTPELREKSDLVWQLSALTLQHEIALVVLLEQIYRVATLRKGEPYHR
jgi:23S rRNA (pseudouridine1915-N3)-methyltransferase